MILARIDKKFTKKSDLVHSREREIASEFFKFSFVDILS